jgi:UDP-GlcNAc:undecaprenyl-phosphate GlcNAc-1-phosphate transferase
MATSAISVTGQVDPGVIAQPDKFNAYFLPAFIPILLPFAVLVVPLLDFGLAMFRRVRAGKSPFSADRKHLHHRLLDMGHSHLHAVLILYGWTLVFSVGCLGYMFLPWYWATLLIIIGFAVCAFLTLTPISGRKALERAAQLAELAEAEPDVVRWDGLDALGEEPDEDAAIEPLESKDAP